VSHFKQSFCIPCFWQGQEETDLRKVLEAAKRIGYPAFEFWFRDNAPFDLLVKLSGEYGLVISTICGHKSLKDGLNKKENHARIRAELSESIEVAKRHGIRNLICFSGNREGKDDEDCLDVVAEGIKQSAGEAEAANVMLVIELLNSKVDHPDYQCDHAAWGVEVCKRVGSPNVKLLYDIYHMQIMEGDLIRTITENIEHIGHFHTAGNPGRNDPDETQEIYYPAVMRAIEETGYDGYVAHEFRAKDAPLAALEAAYKTCDV